MNFKIQKISIKKDYNRKGEPYKDRNKIYIWSSGEFIMDNLNNRRSRPYEYYKQAIIPKVMAEIALSNPEAYEYIKNTTWSWRQKCGCGMCPCSPGFVSRSCGYLDIHVTVLFDELVTEEESVLFSKQEEKQIEMELASGQLNPF